MQQAGIDLLSSSATPVTLVLAGVRIQLDVRALPPPAQTRFLADYAGFIAQQAANEAEAPVHIALEIAVADGPPFCQPAAGEHNWRIETWHRGARLWHRSYCEEGWLDLKAGRGRLLLRPQGHVENFLRMVTARLVLAEGGLLLHASGVVAAGWGYAFFGHSGAGKSTVAGLAPQNALVLSDDLVVLRPDAGGFRLYGVPFRGEALDSPRANASAPLAGLLALEQAAQHELRQVPPSSAAARLLAAAPFLAGDRAALMQALAVCSRLAEAGCVQLLRFAPNAEFWPLLFKADPAS